MIRDGINFKKKALGRKEIEVYSEENLYNLKNALKAFLETKNVGTLLHLRNPYSILYLISPYLPKTDITCGEGDDYVPMEEFFEKCMAGEINEISDQISTDCWSILVDYRDNYGGIDVEVYLRAMSRFWDFDEEEALDSWRFQSDPVALAFTLASSRCGIEKFTPVIGIEYRFSEFEKGLVGLRFPCLVFEWKDGERVQVHKDGETYKVFGGEGVKVEAERSFVVEGIWDGENFWLYDVLNWGDIWLYRRPFAERWQFAWHFMKYLPRVLYVRGYEELYRALSIFEGKGIAVNLNEKYGRKFTFDWENDKCVLEIGGISRGGGKNWLRTIDECGVFRLGHRLTDKVGERVLVDRNGKILGFVDDIPDSWIEVAIRLGLPFDYAVHRRNPPKAKIS